MIWTATPHLPEGASMVDVLGMIPHFLDDEDPRSAAEQLGANYIGGWRANKTFSLLPDNGLAYPCDPVLHPLCEAHLRDEHICVYLYGYTAIIQPDRSFEVSRLD